jgi:predicted DNA-binding transcriptional regulator AlpA
MKSDKPSASAADNLDRDAAAEYLCLSRKTLDNWRTTGRGPRFLKLGARVLYPKTELEAFKAANLRTSTSDRRSAIA